MTNEKPITCPDCGLYSPELANREEPLERRAGVTQDQECPDCRYLRTNPDVVAAIATQLQEGTWWQQDGDAFEVVERPKLIDCGVLVVRLQAQGVVDARAYGDPTPHRPPPIALHVGRIARLGWREVKPPVYPSAFDAHRQRIQTLNRLRAAVRRFTDEGPDGGPNGPSEEAWERADAASERLAFEIGTAMQASVTLRHPSIGRANQALGDLAGALAEVCAADADNIEELRHAFEVFSGETLPACTCDDPEEASALGARVDRAHLALQEAVIAMPSGQVRAQCLAAMVALTQVFAEQAGEPHESGKELPS